MLPVLPTVFYMYFVFSLKHKTFRYMFYSFRYTLLALPIDNWNVKHFVMKLIMSNILKNSVSQSWIQSSKFSTTILTEKCLKDPVVRTII